MNNTFQYTVDGELRNVVAHTYRTEGDEYVFFERWHNPDTGETEREILRVRADVGSVLRLDLRA